MLDNPLRLLMFASSNPTTSEEEILWKIDGLKESLQSPEIIFRKVCKGGGSAVGFAEWTIDNEFKRDGEVSIDYKKEFPIEIKPEKAKDNRAKLPRSLDIHTRAAVSEQFAKEKRRVFQSLGMVWRKSVFKFVDQTQHLKDPAEILLVSSTELRAIAWSDIGGNPHSEILSEALA